MPANASFRCELLVVLACCFASASCRAAAQAWPSFSLDKCRMDRPTLCNLLAPDNTAGKCRFGSAASPTCKNTGLGDRGPWLCSGSQTHATYSTAISNVTLGWLQLQSQPYYATLQECTNLACRLAKPGCVTNLTDHTACWGTVVELESSSSTAAASKAYLGRPCLDTPADQNGAEYLQPNYNVLSSPAQQGLFVQGPWQVCDCEAPSVNSSDPAMKSFKGLDDAIAFISEQHFWSVKCSNSLSISLLLPKGYKDFYCTPTYYGNKQPALLNMLLAFLTGFRKFLTSPEYAQSSFKAAKDGLEALAAALSKVFADFAASPLGRAAARQQNEFMLQFGVWWCKNANVVPVLLMPLVLVFPPLALPLFMSFDAC